MVSRTVVFCDFTYRNPRGKRRAKNWRMRLFFDDMAFLVQVKAQYGNHDAMAWATEATLKALKQVRATHEHLKSGAIQKLLIMSTERCTSIQQSIRTCMGSSFWRNSRRYSLMLTKLVPLD